jgi:hypothetical protein
VEVEANRQSAGVLSDENLSARLALVEAELTQLRQRNIRVEADKAWETSYTRVVFLLCLTYMVTASVFWLITVPHPLRNALIPTVGYWLSTQSLPYVKKWWLRRRQNASTTV